MTDEYTGRLYRITSAGPADHGFHYFRGIIPSRSLPDALRTARAKYPGHAVEVTALNKGQSDNALLAVQPKY